MEKVNLSLESVEVEEDKYIKNRIIALSYCNSYKDKKNLLNSIYDDGFEDGFNEKE